MSYQKADHILPPSLLKEVQKYIDGGILYIPRRESQKKSWGDNTSIRRELQDRNDRIYRDFLSGFSTRLLAEKYFLSVKTIQRILREKKQSA